MTGWSGQTGKIRLNEAAILFWRHSFNARLRSGVVVLAVLLCALIATTCVLAQDNGSAPAGSPDTPVSSDTASPAAADSAPATAADSATATGSDAAAQAETGASSPASGMSQPRSLEVESSSQVRSKITISHEQEAKDRLFVDTTLIAAAVIMSVIAILLFLSMPKQPKKASNDNQ